MSPQPKLKPFVQHTHVDSAAVWVENLTPGLTLKLAPHGNNPLYGMHTHSIITTAQKVVRPYIAVYV